MKFLVRVPDPTLSRMGITCAFLSIAVAIASLTLLIALGHADRLWDDWIVHNVIGCVLLGAVLLLTARAQPRNAAIWTIGIVLGLGTALNALARKMNLPVIVDAAGIGRYPQQIESTVYFCVLEALQNSARHSGARSVTVSLREADGVLVFPDIDDGAGVDATTAQGDGLINVADRIDALGGRLEIRSNGEAGTSIIGSIPVAAMVTA